MQIRVSLVRQIAVYFYCTMKTVARHRIDEYKVLIV